MNKLKPCPFCGKEVFLLDVATRSDADAKWDIFCRTHGCFINGWSSTQYIKREDAIIAWNTRSETSENATIREHAKVLREALEEIANATIEGIDGDEWFNNIANIALDQTKPKDGEEC